MNEEWGDWGFFFLFLISYNKVLEFLLFYVVFELVYYFCSSDFTLFWLGKLCLLFFFIFLLELRWGLSFVGVFVFKVINYVNIVIMYGIF